MASCYTHWCVNCQLLMVEAQRDFPNTFREMLKHDCKTCYKPTFRSAILRFICALLTGKVVGTIPFVFDGAFPITHPCFFCRRQIMNRTSISFPPSRHFSPNHSVTINVQCSAELGSMFHETHCCNRDHLL